MKILACLLLLGTLDAQGATNKILVTGYWPPTNEMLRDFSDKTPGEWKGENWEGLGYDVHAYFPEFQNESDHIGRGDFRVDFAATYNDFMRLTADLNPVAIISFGRGDGPWEIEKKFPNYYSAWFADEAIPSQIGVALQYPIPETLKNSPSVLSSSLPLQGIKNAVTALGADGLTPWIDEGGNAGNYLCGFIGYLGCWYHADHNNPQLADYNAKAGFIHVGAAEVSRAKESFKATLRAVIASMAGTE